MTHSGDPIASRLAAARRRYLERLPERARELEGFLHSEDREALAAAAHRLAGSAGIHGLDPVAAGARALERHCRDGDPWGALRRAAADLVERLEEFAAR